MERWSQDRSAVPWWLRGWAVLTAVATILLIGLGATVTTFRVGMADPVWPTTPWYLFFIDWQEPSAGFLIEHSHRLAGYTVGCLTIVQAVGLWLTVKQGSLRWLGWVALLGVIIQGLLGGFRVRLHALLGSNLAVIHGIFAQLVFSLLVVIAVLASHRAHQPGLPTQERRRLRGPGWLLSALVILQLVWGALMRQDQGRIFPRLHLLTAFAVIAAFVWLVQHVRQNPQSWKLLGRWLLLLTLFFSLQLVLGAEAWLSKFSNGMYPELQNAPTISQAMVRTTHVVLGSLILASSISALVLMLALPSASSPEPSPADDYRTEPAREKSTAVAAMGPTRQITSQAGGPS